MKKNGAFELAIQTHYLEAGERAIYENRADIQGRAKDGSPLIGEFKSRREWKGNSSWWSYWEKTLVKRPYFKNMKALPSKEQRWCAAIDGQLRDYCCVENISHGDLVIEGFSECKEEIETALELLKSNKAISEYNYEGISAKDKHDLGFVRVTFLWVHEDE